MSNLRTHLLPSLVQGVSQQSIEARGLASAEAQTNCLNSLADGVVSRMGSIPIVAFTDSVAQPFVTLIYRNAAEIYAIYITAGSLRVFNLVSGLECSVTGNISAYLNVGSTAVPRENFHVTTVQDTSFVVNKSVEVAMANTTSPARTNEAIAYFRAGSYITTYRLTVTVAGVDYYTEYTTPQGSTASQEQFIKTDRLAQEFADSFVADIVPLLDTAGYTGFTVDRNGSTLRIRGPVDFQVDTTDGMGDTQFISFKDSVRSFSDLPQRCFNGYQVAVTGANDQEKDDYFLKYEGAPSTGVWKEVVAPNTKTTINAATMPQVLKNTGLNTFTVGPATWGLRLAGDGVDTSLDPAFIGRKIVSTAFIGSRLAIITEGSFSLSRANNAYVFFPDTALTDLDTDPIHYDLNLDQVVNIKATVRVAGRLQFWADGAQAVLSSGDNAIKEETVEAIPSTTYTYSSSAPPVASGRNSLLFATSMTAWSSLREVFFRADEADGEIEITAHVPAYISGEVKQIATDPIAKKTFVLTSSGGLYLYQWYNQGTDRIQSAWNRWIIGGRAKPLWIAVRNNILYLLVSWGTSKVFEKIHLDAVGDEAPLMPIRLDHRVSESLATFDPAGFSTITLPYVVDPAGRPEFTVVQREDSTSTVRGRSLSFEWLSGSSIKVLGTEAGMKFYFGSVPTASRQFSEVSIKDSQGNTVLADDITVHDLVVRHKNTVEYSVIKSLYDGTVVAERVYSRWIGNPNQVNGRVPYDKGQHRVQIGEVADQVAITLVNDTVFPATWTAAKYTYSANQR